MSLTSKLLNGLNNEQAQAVTSESKTILCQAGAGSGKTTVLTRRIARLFDERVGTSNMLALTFTRLAGHEMKERFARIIGEEHGKKLFCNTFHAFCVQVLKTWGHRIGLEPNFTVYDQADQESIITAVIKDCKYKTKVKDVLIAINYKARGDEPPREVSHDAIAAAAEYFSRLARNNAITLDELLTRTLHLMRQADIAESYRREYTHVFVDEFQDTDDVQMEIIKRIAPANLFAVGDGNQSIYRFRGAVVGNILDFPEHFPDTEVVKLEQNYRSTHMIIDAANRLIRCNVNRTDMTLVAQREGRDIELVVAKNEDWEAAAIAGSVAEHLANGGKAADIAVLARTNHQLEIVNEKLKEAKIPSVIVNASADPFKRKDVALLMRFIEFVINPEDERALQQTINFPFQRLTDLQMKRADVVMDQSGIMLDEALEFEFIGETEEFFRAVNKLRKDTEIRFFNLDATEAIKQAGYAIGLKTYYEEHGLQNRMQDILDALAMSRRWCEQQARAGYPYDIVAFMKWLRIRDVHDYFRKEEDSVRCVTVHGSKGLEFDTVYLIGMNQGAFPSRRAKTPEDLEEERRLMYVAVTRAKNRLVISRPEQTVGFNKQIEIREPSQFLLEMGV